MLGPTARRASRLPRASSWSGRAPWGSVSRESVIEAAVRVVDAGGYRDMSIRSLAADLGVAPMTLYRHVDDKNDLLDEVVDRLLARSWRPSLPRDDWRAWITQAADRLRRFLVRQPAALHVYLRHPVVSRAAVARMNAMMAVLRLGMGDEDRARRAYAAIHTYTLGFAALEAGRSRWTPGHDDGDGLAPELASYTSPRQFADGLRYLLDGIGG
ncbi:MAG: TetR/AcrR family transcriptional regulator [Candidatus Dormibacteria bacterium]